MTDSYPTRAPGHDSTFAEGILRSLRRLPWSPEHHWRFPRPCRRRMTFLAWVGGVLGLQPAWTKVVLPLVGWTDALPEPPKAGGLAQTPPSPAFSAVSSIAPAEGC
uniref:Uncharacterized protein n=1 Tax=Alexandrium andersonii TaxID=327968 RepID=A0A7S2B5M9_9DINO|mmetsp:Transcript_22374/g.50934  ORF Transcript_22374/g.50934 Transcript_22374/m.50934 type:complete len:106 (+) Transcript_22374:1-318(+)